jgi:hypothetical protein
MEISSGYILRNWGTDRGIGQVAIAGPLEGTIMDALPTIQVPYQSVVFSVKCSHPAWETLCLEEEQESFPNSNFHICVLPRGWVKCGYVERTTDPVGRPMVTLSRSATVRQWGTEQGLGQLAFEGPIKDKTILDPSDEIVVPAENILFSIPCDESKWTEYVNSHPESSDKCLKAYLKTCKQATK